MISIAKEMCIRLLLAEGMSQRQVALKARTSRDTVKVIGESPELRPRRKSKRLLQLKKLKTPRKCLTCGAKVNIWPCLYCHPETGEPNGKTEKETTE